MMRTFLLAAGAILVAATPAGAVIPTTTTTVGPTMCGTHCPRPEATMNPPATASTDPSGTVEFDVNPNTWPSPPPTLTLTGTHLVHWPAGTNAAGATSDPVDRALFRLDWSGECLAHTPVLFGDPDYGEQPPPCHIQVTWASAPTFPAGVSAANSYFTGRLEFRFGRLQNDTELTGLKMTTLSFDAGPALPAAEVPEAPQTAALLVGGLLVGALAACRLRKTQRASTTHC